MKRMRKLIGAVTAVVCGMSAAVPLGASAEELFPEIESLAASYSTADINRNRTVDITDVLVLNQFLTGSRYVASNSLMDTNGNRVISAADSQHVMAETVKNSYVNNVDGCSANFYGGTTTNVYVPSGKSVSCKYYRHVYSGTATDTSYVLSMTEAALPTGETASTDAIIGTDDRVPEYDSDINSGICRLGNGATGFVVGDHEIATAAHCCFNGTAKVWLPSSTMYVQFPQAGANTGSISLDSHKYYAVQAHVNYDYYLYNITNNQPHEDMHPYDYAVLTVAEDLSNRYHFNLGIPYNVTSSPFASYDIYATGFPQTFDSNTRYLYTGAGKMYSNSQDGLLLHYSTDTTGGNSGSPVYLKETYDAASTYGEYNTVIGIHSGLNCGPCMTPIMLKFFLNNPYASH